MKYFKIFMVKYMIESKLVKRTHELMLKPNIKKIAIDATLGNGYDSIYLSNYYENVIGIDIQPLAIKRSEIKTKNIKNIKLYLDDFNNIDKFKYANLIIFNLGFLPGSNRKIKTQDYTPENAILKAYSILDGFLLIACYVQHDGGYLEYQKILKTLDDNNINYIIENEYDSKEILLIIEKMA